MVGADTAVGVVTLEADAEGEADAGLAGGFLSTELGQPPMSSAHPKIKTSERIRISRAQDKLVVIDDAAP